MSMSDIQKHLTEPPIPIGGYAEKTMSDEEIGRIIKEQADMCMSILNGGENGMSNMKYYVCCPMCDKEKCVRGTEECDAEKWEKESDKNDE